MSSRSLDIHLIAIGGTGMAPLACLLQEAGHRVRGSDGPLYPPMSTLLEAAGIRPCLGFDPRHLDPRPDLVVVGNAVRRDNPEALEAERRGIELASMPQALWRFFLRGREPLVVAGTHGKTTTTAMAAWVYTACGADPGYLVGGMPRDLPASFRRGSGRRFIVEGDEYNAAYFDRGPKFLHYRARTLILTGAEYDHADLYSDPVALLAAYRELVARLPADGLLVACGDDPAVRELARRAPCPAVLYGLGPGNDVHPRKLETSSLGTRFLAAADGGEAVAIELALAGEHNAANALAVWAAARADGLPPGAVAAALARFRGVRRRLEELGEAAGVTVVDDFAHHPTAVAMTLAALAQRYPGRRRVALFEPRSLTAGRAFLFDAYVEAFQGADLLLVAPVFHAARFPPDELLDLPALCTALGKGGRQARAAASPEDLLAQALAEIRPGDVVVSMSSGEFGGLPRRLLAALRGRQAPERAPAP